ncbi:MAG: HD-GYP domain-containing protein [Anaerolineaceae bacterium]|nr:HD-GYP domain-containing protein [Anaerolineaceae bacterium]
MISRLVAWYRVPVYDNIEETQKSRFLYITLLVTIGTSLVIGFQNIREDTYIGIALFVLAAVCLICIPLSNHGYYNPVAAFISVLVLGLITLSLIEGIGMRDSGLLAYPVLIIFTSFLFSREVIIITTLTSLASIELVYYLEHTGRLSIPEFDLNTQLVVVSVMVMAVGLAMWVYKDNWEKILANLRRTYDLTLSGWSQALELRDRETEGHSQRAVEMTLDIARKLGVSRLELEQKRRGALLHDIGKMAVPDAILLKPGKLTKAEWQVIHQHPQQAVRMLENIPYLKSALAIPHSHHERWDGSGYPQGLKGETIPFAARIFAVVDVWDALTSDRPYRKAWSDRKARTYLKDKSGVLFDPQVVDVFLELIERGTSMN